jgi:hypothetical protein
VASVRLAHAGCTQHEIAAITGHASLKEIERYTKTVERKRLAHSAMEGENGNRHFQAVAEFDKKRKNNQRRKFRVAPLPGYVSNHVPCAARVFSQASGGNAGSLR